MIDAWIKGSIVYPLLVGSAVVSICLPQAANAAPKDIVLKAIEFSNSPVEAVYGNLKVRLSSGLDKLDGTASDALADIVTPKGRIEMTLPGDIGPFSKARIVRLSPSIYPQVVFERATGGNACCVRTSIASFDNGRWHIVATVDLVSPQGGYEIADLDGDGFGELLFMYDFAGFEAHVHDYASPPRIQVVQDGRLIDVTADPKYRSYVRKALPGLSKSSPVESKSSAPIDYSMVATWMAGMALIGKTGEAWSFLGAHYANVRTPSYICSVPNAGDVCPDGKVKPMPFLKALRSELLNTGIVKDEAALPLPNP